MARDTNRCIIDVEVGADFLHGANLVVYYELYRLVNTVGRPFQRGWFCELARRLRDRLSPDGEDNESYIIPLPIVEHLYIHCKIECDEFGWFWLCDIANDSLLQYWLQEGN